MGTNINETTGEVSTLTDICVVGLGYVGLPLAQHFDTTGHTVYGYDVDAERIEMLEAGYDPTGDVGDSAIADSSIDFSTDESMIREAEYVIVAVPTPVDDLEKPDLGLVEAAGQTIGEHILPGTTVVLESTVYPGATREVLVNIERQQSRVSIDALDSLI